MQLINNSTLYNLSEKRTEIMGVAMLLVIAYHFALHFGFYHSPIIVRGDIGVDIFFFLSGFGCGFSVSKHSPKDFYANRIKRIVPIYFIIGILSIIRELSVFKSTCLRYRRLPSFMHFVFFTWRFKRMVYTCLHVVLSAHATNNGND